MSKRTFRDTGSVKTFLTVDGNGQHTGRTEPESKPISPESIQGWLDQVTPTPPSGTYEFHTHKAGTVLAFASAGQLACTLGIPLEVLVDRDIGRPLFDRTAAARDGALAEEASHGGMHGASLHTAAESA